MAQKKDLNISPYYDDFDPSNNFYKVLFKPGYPVQARELTSLQSILQNQVEEFGSHMFKEGSEVIPGGVTIDVAYDAVKLNATQFGIDISLYTNELIGKIVEGEITGVSATVEFVALPDGGDVEDITIYVKYQSAGIYDPTKIKFVNGEGLIVKESLIYGNTTINAGTTVATLIASGATSIGSAASIAKGVYFVRGTFVNVDKQTIILDHYTNTPSYRIGLKVDEIVISAKDDPSLYDNAKGFTNYAAPGADRLKISLTLSKKLLTNKNDTDFIEIARTDGGQIKKINNKTQYNLIRDYIAERTYEESGNYALQPFNVTISNSLNDRLGNGGLYYANQKTENGNTPSDDLMCVSISEGEAYVKGYDIKTDSTSVIDVPKPRDTKTTTGSVPFNMGNNLVINNLEGQPQYREVIDLYGELQQGTTHVGIIGKARVYSVTPRTYQSNGQASSWDLRLYDVQMFDRVALNDSLTASEVTIGYHIKGKNSGAEGYSASNATDPVRSGISTNWINVDGTKGTYLKNEPITINGEEKQGNLIKEVVKFSPRDVKSIQQASAGVYTRTFKADAVLQQIPFPNGITQGDISGGNKLESPGKIFTNIKTGDILSYQKDGQDDINYNVIKSVADGGRNLELAAVSSVAGVYRGAVDNTARLPIFKAVSSLDSNDVGLYGVLPEKNISSVDFSSSTLTVSAQLTGQSLSGMGGTASISAVKDGSGVAISTAFFEPYNISQYSVHFGSTSGFATVTADKFELLSGGSTLSLSGLGTANTNSDSNTVISITAEKQGIQSKVKQYQRSQLVTVDKSNFVGSGSSVANLNDGLTYNSTAYGLRVQDESISLNVADVSRVLAVYESLDTSAPTLDHIEFSSSANVLGNAKLGENITGSNSGAIARVVTNNSSTPSSGGTNRLGVVYLNEKVLNVNEQVVFEESNIQTVVESINSQATDGQYHDITNSFYLDKGQREQYYDYSRIIRRKNTYIPSRQLLIVMDYYDVPSDDTGDVFSVLSYGGDRYTNDIPLIGNSGIRATDTLDFRPRVSPFTATDSSPFSFQSRTTGFGNAPKFIVTTNENTLVKYDYYLARIDKIYLDVGGQLQLVKGQPAKNPYPPMDSNDSMLVADVILPPYLYNPRHAQVTLADNRRYTMRDIGSLEDRIESLETVTTLSLLEVSTEAMTIQDAYGRDRFKSGFFVDSFINDGHVDLGRSSITVDTNNKVIRPLVSRNSLSNLLLPAISTVDEELDFGTNYTLYDPNVQKTGNAVTLKYDEVPWVEQSFATEQENVNPFHVVSFSSGTITLSPESDTWSRTIQQEVGPESEAIRSRISDINSAVGTMAHRRQFGSSIAHLNLQRMDSTEFDPLVQSILNSGLNYTYNTESESHTVSSSAGLRADEYTVRHRSITLRDGIIFSGEDGLMRSRNTSFYGTGLRPFERHYQFLDGNGDVDVIPKLIEIASDEARLNYGSSTAFQVGETVKGYIDTNHSGPKEIFSVRVATSNHKEGPFGNPTKIYTDNPYAPNENIQASYTSTSKVLNIDTIALSAEAQGLYKGYITNQTRLVGQTSGAVAYVKDIRLKPDGAGEVQGAFFLRDPNTTPPPSVTIETGTKTYKLTSSSSNAKPATGSNLISSAAVRYRSVGSLTVEGQIIEIEDRDVTIRDYWDPLAQSFTVGANIEAPDSSGSLGDDDNGIFLTSVDLFFANKSTSNKAVTVEVRTMELGTPTRNRIGRGVTLLPNEITTSTDGSVATNVKFPEPIYLPPGQEYAIVLLAPTSMEYEVFTATMGAATLQSQDLPNASSVIYSEQWALGSLFKSQNGSIWEPSQLQDMKLKLYKAKFVNSGTAFFANPTLNSSNGFGAHLGSNPILTLPKTGQIKIDTLTVGFSTFTGGTKIHGSTDDSVVATIVDTGCSASRVGVITGGTGYQNASAVETFAVTGKGQGFKCDIEVDANGTIKEFLGITTTANGTGYRQGDIVGIVTAGASGSGTGTGALFTITAKTDGIDTLFLTNIKGTGASGGFVNNGAFRYTDGTGTIQTVVGTLYDGNLVEDGTPNDGKHIYISQFDHGMYATNNKLTVTDVRGNSYSTNLGVALTTTEADTVSVGSTAGLDTFEGLTVSATNPGYIRVGDEIIGYESVGSGTLEGLGRGTDSTQIIPHDAGTYVEKYELNGVSLRRINKEHTISSHDIGFDDYYIEIDRSANGVDRSADSTGKPQLSFDNEAFLGGDSVQITKNIQYDAVVPTYNLRTPSSATEATASIRTVSGTSIGGNEVSFLDQGFEPIQLNTENQLTTPRLVCSKVNENEYLNNIDRNKSFTTAIEFKTSDESVSPVINLRRAQTEFRSNRLNNPASDYATNELVKTSLYDNHSAIYVSNLITLDKPADSLKVILSANRPASSDFRVLYALVKKDSNTLDERYTLFPGYDNLRDTDENGFGDEVIDPANNSGLPDTFVSASVSNEFLEYQFTANDLGEFTGYKIKIVMSGTNQAQEPRITDLRTIALK